MGELFGGGETHADIVSKLAALASITATSPGSPIPQAHYFRVSYTCLSAFRFDEKRAQSLPSAVTGGVLCLSGKNIQTRLLRNEWITKLGAIGLRAQ